MISNTSYHNTFKWIKFPVYNVETPASREIRKIETKECLLAANIENYMTQSYCKKWI